MISLKKTIFIGFFLGGFSFNLHSPNKSIKKKEEYPMTNVAKKIQKEEQLPFHQKKISLNDGSKPGGNKIFSREDFFPNPQYLQAPAFFAYRQKGWNPSTKIDSILFKEYKETSMKNGSFPVKKNSPEKKKIFHRVKENKSFFSKCCPFVSGSDKKNQRITKENQGIDSQEDEFFSAKESHSSNHSSQESLLNQQAFSLIHLVESDKFSMNNDDFVSFDEKKFNDTQEENQLVQEENQLVQEENQPLPKENYEGYKNFFNETRFPKDKILQATLEKYDQKVLCKPEETKDIQDQEEERDYDFLDKSEISLEMGKDQRKKLENKVESVSKTDENIANLIKEGYL